MNLVIWGTGKGADDFMKLLNFDNISILAFVDNNIAKQGTVFWDIARVISPEEVAELQYDLLIIGSSFEREITAQCEKLGLKNYISSNITFDTIMNYPDMFNKIAFYKVCETKNVRKTADEILWREIFKDTVAGYDWYNVSSISLGRWAIGYNYAYVLARVLEELKPKSILELGLGQSSKIINSYVDYQKNKKLINYEVVEQSKEWLEFFIRDNLAADNIIVYQREIEQKKFDGENSINVYSDFESVIKNKKYSFISIDGPWGSKYISRIDILPFVPDILEEDFVIMIDDYNRMGEKRMIARLENKLKESAIEYFTGVYESQCDVCIICSSRWRFFTSL